MLAEHSRTCTLTPFRISSLFIFVVSRMNTFRIRVGKNGKLSKTLEAFLANPAVIEFYELMNSPEFKTLREYRNRIAHTSVSDPLKLEEITGYLINLIPSMSEKEALYIQRKIITF